LKWEVVATVCFLAFFLYAIIPAPVDAVVLALYIGLVAVSMLIPLRGGEASASKAASVYLRLFVVQAITFSTSLLLILPSSILHLGVEKYTGAALVILPTLFLVNAPGLRLARLGDYLKRYAPVVSSCKFCTRIHWTSSGLFPGLVSGGWDLLAPIVSSFASSRVRDF
jgi:hypothetical protein